MVKLRFLPLALVILASSTGWADVRLEFWRSNRGAWETPPSGVVTIPDKDMSARQLFANALGASRTGASLVKAADNAKHVLYVWRRDTFGRVDRAPLLVELPADGLSLNIFTSMIKGAIDQGGVTITTEPQP